MDEVWDIKGQPEQEFEARVVIWNTKDVICTDIEGTSDVFTKVYIDNEVIRETDTHFRCSTGAASFNYRLLFNVKTPRKNTKLTI